MKLLAWWIVAPILPWVLLFLATFLVLNAVAQEIASTDPTEVCGKVGGMTYSKRHRGLLPDWERKEDFARAGVPWSDHAKYELDHVVPLALGGADTPANRRPQPCARWAGHRCVAGEAHSKDLLENRDIREACDPRQTVDEARARLVEKQSHYATPDSWRAAFRQAFGVDP